MAIIARLTLNILALCLGIGTSQAEQPVKTIDGRGCVMRITDGKETLIRPTLNFVNVSYGESKFISNEKLLRIAQIALAVGCPVNDFADEFGLSHLNTAILFNHPELVKLLLAHGADPHLTIVAPGKSWNGKDSYGLLARLMKSPDRDRREVHRLLESQRGNRSQGNPP